MFIPELASLELRQCDDLPRNTMVAPLSVIREVRCLLGKIGINLVVGVEETVLASTDLFEAFKAWDAMQEELEAESEDDNAWLN